MSAITLGIQTGQLHSLYTPIYTYYSIWGRAFIPLFQTGAEVFRIGKVIDTSKLEIGKNHKFFSENIAYENRQNFKKKLQKCLQDDLNHFLNADACFMQNV